MKTMDFDKAASLKSGYCDHMELVQITTDADNNIRYAYVCDECGLCGGIRRTIEMAKSGMERWASTK